MNLSDYPRPLNDTGIGVHGPASTDRFETPEYPWPFWKRLYEECHIRWSLFLTDSGISNLDYAKRLVDNGIMPICRFFYNQQYPNYSINPAAIREYVRIGVPYFVFGNEPDSKREWSINPPHNWLEIVVETFIRDAKICVGEGGIPVFPAFSFGSDPDRPNVVQMILDRAGPEIFERMCWSVHNYGLGRPVEYPDDPVTKTGQPITQAEYDSYGQPGKDWRFSWEVSIDEVNRQRAARPEVAAGTDNILKNPTCFRNYEYFDHLIREAVGYSIPIFGTESGWNFRAGIQGDNRWPFRTPQEASQITLESYKYIQEQGPAYYFAGFYWLLGHDVFGLGQSDYEFQGPLITTQFREFGLKDNEYPLVQMLRDHQNKVRANGPLPEQWPLYKGPDLTGRNFADELKYTEPMTILEPISGPAQTYWRLQEVRWEKQGRGVAFVRCKVDGQFIEGQRIISKWEGEESRAHTKGAADNYYGDVSVPVLASIFVADNIPSDRLTNVYQGTVYLTFEKVEGATTMFNHLKLRQQLLTSSVVFMPGPNYKVKIREGIKEAGQVYYKIRGIYHLAPEENAGNHNLYVDVVDEQGARLNGALVGWTWEGRQDNEVVRPVRIGDKGPNEVADIAVGSNQIVSAWIQHNDTTVTNSDSVFNVTTVHPDEGPGNTIGHHSFYVLWQRTRIGQPEPEPPTPDQPPAPDILVRIKDKLMEISGDMTELKSEIDEWLSV